MTYVPLVANNFFPLCNMFRRNRGRAIPLVCLLRLSLVSAGAYRMGKHARLRLCLIDVANTKQSPCNALYMLAKSFRDT